MDRTRAVRLIFGSAVLLGAACSAGGGVKSGQTLGGTGSTGNGGGGNATGNGGVGAGNVAGNGTGNIFIGTGGTSTTGDGASGCVETISRPEQVTTTVTISLPLDMFIMYDQSGSMTSDVGNNTSRWDAVKAALTGFINDPASAGVGVGIQYFPLNVGPTTCQQGDPNCTCVDCFCFLGVCLFPPGCTQGVPVCTPNGGGSCAPADYATPEVPIALLPGVGPAIINSVNAHNPGGGTPTEPALQGAINYASAYAATIPLGDGGVPTRKTIVVLATDGQPNDCSSDVPGVSAIAAAGLAATPSIQTFVIGVGGSLQNLDAIAAAGGTGTAFIVDGSNATQQFIDAMNQIRTVSQQSQVISTPVPCEWEIPPMPSGQLFDANKVTVKINGTDVKYARDSAACTTAVSTSTDAWLYDNPTNPTKVLLCSHTCDSVKAQTSPTVDVVFGCTEHEVIE